MIITRAILLLLGVFTATLPQSSKPGSEVLSSEAARIADVRSSPLQDEAAKKEKETPAKKWAKLSKEKRDEQQKWFEDTTLPRFKEKMWTSEDGQKSFTVVKIDTYSESMKIGKSRERYQGGNMVGVHHDETTGELLVFRGEHDRNFGEAWGFVGTFHRLDSETSWRGYVMVGALAGFDKKGDTISVVIHREGHPGSMRKAKQNQGLSLAKANKAVADLSRFEKAAAEAKKKEAEEREKEKDAKK